jgi:diacylglycerol diphosphate phosphatase/phosphatidate phosphatase
MKPFHRMFSLDDKAIMYPFAVHEQVPVRTAPSEHLPF